MLQSLLAPEIPVVRAWRRGDRRDAARLGVGGVGMATLGWLLGSALAKKMGYNMETPRTIEGFKSVLPALGMSLLGAGALGVAGAGTANEVNKRVNTH